MSVIAPRGLALAEAALYLALITMHSREFWAGYWTLSGIGPTTVLAQESVVVGFDPKQRYCFVQPESLQAAMAISLPVAVPLGLLAAVFQLEDLAWEVAVTLAMGLVIPFFWLRVGRRMEAASGVRRGLYQALIAWSLVYGCAAIFVRGSGNTLALGMIGLWLAVAVVGVGTLRRRRVATK